ncbi:hypothetical protein E4U41_006518 [Claviceps citrina]|nr:hypothetical protein E4U41_006518 [Claviceps citrina]
MGFGRFVHHTGTLCLVAAFVLLLVVTITAPVANGLSMMHVNLGRNAASARQVTFGTFGYCVRGIRGASDDCTRSRIGYNPAALMRSLDGTNFGSAAADTAKGLTRVMVLHPVAMGLCFIAVLLCCCAGAVGSLLASVVSLVAFVVTLVAMICDFVAFGIVKRDVNGHGVSRAKWGSGIWLVLVAALLTLLGAAIVLFTCCCARRRDRTGSGRHKESWNEAPATATTAGGVGRRRRFWR